MKQFTYNEIKLVLKPLIGKCTSDSISPIIYTLKASLFSLAQNWEGTKICASIVAKFHDYQLNCCNKNMEVKIGLYNTDSYQKLNI